MIKQKDILFWNVLFGSGAIFVFLISIVSLINLSNSGKWLYSLICAAFCFLTAFLSSKTLENQEVSKEETRRFIFIGFALLLITAGFVWIDIQNLRVPDWMNYLLSFSIAIYYAVYRLIFVAMFPKARKVFNLNTSPPDPLNDLPRDLQELVDKGKESVGKTTINVTTTCAILISISIFFLGGVASPLTFLVIEVFVSIIFILIARYFSAYKWQKQAIQSEISEKKLKSAAKLAGLPWLNIRENNAKTR